ncbi:hypothetical protein MMC18_009038 [Xylographa bjoerkii]|nr:hypothetical protein [Xylographa bjoerkii]
MAPNGYSEHYGDMVEPIAIIGMACRFPGEASSVENFWDMMYNARTGHSKIPATRFNADSWYHPDNDRRGAINTKHGFFLEEDPSSFDAPFFSITAKEAAGMDPMQRKLLEIAYEGFENAGLPIEQLAGSMTAVYTGVMTNDYELLSGHDAYDLPQNAASGTSRAMLSNRLSWFFDLRGPSLTLDTACSSSLYAFHLACQSLRGGESRQALVTGVNLILHPNFVSQLSSMHMLSPDGISHSFDARANGYARGEAIGALVLKPLKAALADGDTIRAIVRGTGVNQDGKTPGITMPRGEAQAALIRSTYAAAGLSLLDTGYFESHGTGTPLGDPIELGAIGGSFGAARGPEAIPLYVGSVKTNIGHTEGTAGLAGVIKAVLSLERGVIPANAGFENLNPKLRLEEWKIALPLKTMPWPTSGLRRASINSFGFGGSNAHVILDDAYSYLYSHNLSGNNLTYFDDGAGSDSGISMEIPSPSESEVQVIDKTKLFVFSSHDQVGIKRVSTLYSSFLYNRFQREQQDLKYLEDLAFTLAFRRSHFDFRSFTVASSIDGAAKQVQNLPKLKRVSRHDNVILVFTGQGAQWPSMGRELLNNPVFKKSMLRSQAYLESFGCLWNAIELLMDRDSNKIDIPEYCQPICTALQIALVDLLLHWGVKPKATVGHSSGEIGAAYAAGGISHESSMKIGYFRGVYVDEIQRRLKDKNGTMMAAGLTEAEAQRYLSKVTEGTAVIGCINSPTSVTLSGDEETLTHLEGVIKNDGKFARKLRVKVAYHSPHMQVVADDFLQSMGSVETSTKFSIPMFSSVTTQRVELPSELNAAYWVKNMVSSVRFSGAVTNLLSYSTTVKGRRRTPLNWSAMVEIGPHETLKGPLNQIMAEVDSKLTANVTYSSLIRRGQHAVETAMETAGLLWSLGHSIDIAKVNRNDESGSLAVLTDLPPYPWQHNKGFWHEPLTSASARFRHQPRTDLLGVPTDNQNALEPRWRNFLRLPENPWMEDHVITGTVLYPGAGMLIMVLEAALVLADASKDLVGVEFNDVTFDRGLVIPSADEAVETSLSVRPHESLDSWYHWTVYSIPPGGSWTKHSFGMFSIIYGRASSDFEADLETSVEWKSHVDTFEDIKYRATKIIDPSTFYKQLETIGMGYGPLFTNLISAAAISGEHTGYGTVVIPDTSSSMPRNYEFPHLIHPATLDAIFHLIFVALNEGDAMKEAAIPVTMERMFIAADLPKGVGAKFVGFSRAVRTNSREASGDLVVSNEAWSDAKVIVHNMSVREVSSGDAARTSPSSSLGSPRRVAQLKWKEDIDHLTDKLAAKLLKEEAWKHQSTASSEAAAQLSAWLERACHKHADLKVLVVNPKDNSDVLDLLSQYAPHSGQSMRFKECTIIEESQELLDQVEQTLLSKELAVDYEVLNLIETRHEGLEGFGPFDLVLAGTKILLKNPHILSRIESLLCPEGRIALLGQKFDQANDETSCQAVLKDSAFKKLLVFIENDRTNVIVASVQDKIDVDIVIKEIYLLERPGNHVSSMKDQLFKTLGGLGIAVKTALLSDAHALRGKAVISLLEVEDPFITSWNAEDLKQFQQLVTTAEYLMWITRGGALTAGMDSLRFASTSGLLRAVRVEVPQIVLPHLDLSANIDPAADTTMEIVTAVLRSSLKAKVDGKINEMEYIESNGKLFIPRVVTDQSFDHELELYSTDVKAVQGLLHRGNRKLKLETAVPGVSESLRWVDDEEAAEYLSDEDIEIRPTHVSLNISDIEAVSGKTLSTNLGREAVGIITRVGSKVFDFEPGERVVVLKSHALRTHLRQKRKLFSKIPNSIRSEVAVSLPTAFITAYHVLIDVARLSRGESVLIDSAAEDIGQAIIQVAKTCDANIFATVGSEEMKGTLITKYGLANDHIFDSRSISFAATIRRMTEGKGVDVIISSCSGVALKHLTSCLANFGRFVSTVPRIHATSLHSASLEGNVMISSIDISRLSDTKRASLLKLIFDNLEKGLIGEVFPTTKYSITELQKALAHMRTRDCSGKLVLTLEETAMVPLLPLKPPRLELNADATYVLSGGLGALGLTIAENMCQHGARHLVFLSRSGAATLMQQQVLQGFRDRGCKADALKCDVTNELQVELFVETCKANNWQVKGLIQCAMVLRDSIFENMTMEKWLGATEPKIKGTWNLHSFLPRDLDFFIILSSMSGIIGNTAQANYCAGNTYEDAIAHFRHANGQAATTLNIGLVTDASHFNEGSTIEDYLKKYGHWVSATVTDNEMQTVLIAAMRGQTADEAKVPVQLLVGITDDVQRDGLNLWPNDRKFDHRVRQSSESESEGKYRIEDVLRGAQSVREATLAVEDALRTNVALAMTASPEDIDVEKPLYSFGIDSLKAIEVRNWIFRDLKCDVSVFDILSPMPLAKLALKLVGRSSLISAELAKQVELEDD